MTEDEIVVLERRILDVQTNVAEIKDVVIVLKERSDHAKENCPMRIDIVRAINGVAEARREARDAETLAIEAVKAAHANEVTLARLGFAAGGGGMIGGLVSAITIYLMNML